MRNKGIIMSIINKAFIKRAFELESNRRNPPLDEKGFSKGFEVADKEYTKFLKLYGYLILQEIEKHIKE